MSNPSHSDDDNLSSSSSKSSSTSLPSACPYCSWNKQSRYLFGHIVSEHYKEIYGYIGTAKDVKDDLEEGNLLRIFWTYNIYKPDDVLKENPDTHNAQVFGCLGCKGSYQKIYKAQSHWKKSPKCHKEHTKRVKKFLEEIEKSENTKNQKPWYEDLSEQELDIGLERFRRWYYCVLNCWIPFLKQHPLNKGKDIAIKYLNFEFRTEFENLKDKLDSYLYYSTFIHNMNIHIDKKFYRSSDDRLPNPWALQDTFLEEGLPPVGTPFDRNPVEEKENQRKLLEERIAQEQQKVYEKRLQEEIAKLKVQIKKEEESGAYEETKEEEKKEIKLETILEEPPKKEKRNSFTIPRPDMTALITTPTAPAPVVYPSIINNTKKKREVKTVPK